MLSGRGRKHSYGFVTADLDLNACARSTEIFLGGKGIYFRGDS